MKVTIASLADVKSYLKIPVADTSQDAILTIMLDAVTSQIETHCGISFTNLTRTDTLDFHRDGNGVDTIYLSVAPVTSIQSVMDDSVPVTSFNFTTDGILTITSPPTFTGKRFSVVVEYLAGYLFIPGALMFAGIQAVAETFKARDRVGIQAQTIAGDSVSYSSPTPGATGSAGMAYSPAVMSAINDFCRRVRF
jgi:hypothetical protein